MTILPFNFWPFTTMTICRWDKNAKVGTKVCQLQILHPKNSPKTFKMFPKSQNFAKSGHTLHEPSLPNV